MPLIINEIAYLKIACHAAKYVTKDVYGLLLGNENGIQDVVPLSHLPLNSCFLHSALDIIARVLTKNSDLNICGFYDFEESFPNDEASFHLQKAVLSSIQALAKGKKAYYIRVEARKLNKSSENLQEMTILEALGEFGKNDYGLQFLFYSYDNGISQLPESQVEGRFSISKFQELFERNEHLNICDMDDHFDNPANDLMNPAFLS